MKTLEIRRFDLNAMDSTIGYHGAIFHNRERCGSFKHRYTEDEPRFFLISDRGFNYHLVNYNGVENDPADIPVLAEIFRQLEAVGSTREYIWWPEDKHNANSDFMGRWFADSADGEWQIQGGIWRMSNNEYRHDPAQLKEDACIYFKRLYDALRKCAEAVDEGFTTFERKWHTVMIPYSREDDFESFLEGNRIRYETIITDTADLCRIDVFSSEEEWELCEKFLSSQK